MAFLKDLVTIEKGKKVIPTDEITEDSIRYIQIGDLRTDKNYQYCEIDSSYKIANEDDIIIAWDGANAGQSSYGLNGAIGSTLALLKRKSEDYYTPFLGKYINSKFDYFQKNATGATIPHLSRVSLDNLQIPLPPLDIQKKIADTLDKAQELTDKRKEQIFALDKFLENLFLDMFGDPVSNPMGWEEEKFSFFAKIDTKMTKEFDKYAEYPHIGIANIEKDSGKLINYLKVKDENLISGKYLFDERHIIYSKIRPNLNKVALPNFKGLSSADSYPILVKSENSNRYFFAHILRSSFFLNYILQHSDRTNIPKVNKEQLEGFECYAPPLDLQNQFASLVEKVEAEKTKLEDSLKEMEDNFNSIMQRAFKGKLF